MEKSQAKYIYCIIKTPQSFGVEFCGVGGACLYLIKSGELAAVVSDSPITDYPITRENTMTHQRAIEEVMRVHSTVLPVSFGTVADDRAVIEKKFLGSKQSELLDALKNVKGKVELNLKAIWLDMPKIFQKVVQENPELNRIKQAMSGKMLGRDEAIEVGKSVAAAVELRRERIKEEILEQLEGIAVDHQETQLLGEQMIFNLAFLIPEKKQKTFDQIVRNLDEQYADENAYFKYIGPIPPFNFVRMPISLT